MSDSQNSKSKDGQFLELQKDQESDLQVAAPTDVSEGKDTGGDGDSGDSKDEGSEQKQESGGDSGSSGSDSSGGSDGAVLGGTYVLPSERNKVKEDLESSDDSGEQQEQSSDDSGSGDSSGSSSGQGNTYPLPSEIAEQEREAQAQESNE